MKATEYRRHALLLAKVFDELGRDGASRYYESLGLQFPEVPKEQIRGRLDVDGMWWCRCSIIAWEDEPEINDFSLRRAEGWAVELLCHSIVGDTRGINEFHRRLAARRALLSELLLTRLNAEQRKKARLN